jgi:hypothetical protein
MELDRKGEKLETSAAKAGMAEKTARKYRGKGGYRAKSAKLLNRK